MPLTINLSSEHERLLAALVTIVRKPATEILGTRVGKMLEQMADEMRNGRRGLALVETGPEGGGIEIVIPKLPPRLRSGPRPRASKDLYAAARHAYAEMVAKAKPGQRMPTQRITAAKLRVSTGLIANWNAPLREAGILSKKVGRTGGHRRTAEPTTVEALHKLLAI